MNLNDAIRLATIIRGVQRKASFVMYDMETNKVTKGQMLRIYRAGEDFARDSDDVLDLSIEFEYTDFRKGYIPVREAIAKSHADEFFVE